MTTSFRTPYEVIQRDIGQIVNGKYILADDTGIKITVMASVQNPSTRDRELIQTTEYGRRAGRHIKIYTEQRLRCANQEIAPGRERYAGDIFLFDGSQYLLFGEANFTTLAQSRETQVSHYRYYACEVIETEQFEQVP
jgi:hypothetical protein